MQLLMNGWTINYILYIHGIYILYMMCERVCMSRIIHIYFCIDADGVGANIKPRQKYRYGLIPKL